MSLRVWLPLTKDLRNQGLDDVTVTNNGATFDANGKLGGCYNFDGSHYFQSNKKIGEGWKEITFACWVYLNEVVLTSGSWYRILGIGAHTRVHLDIASNNTLRLFVSQTGTTSGLGVYSTTVGQAGKWYHLCGVLGNNYMSIYINGLKESEKIIDSSSITYTNADYFRVGGITSGNAFNGKISDVRVYDHALSPLEVKQISQGLILHYPLNNNGFGQKNLLIDTLKDQNKTHTAYSIADYNFSEHLVEGEKYTITASITTSSEKTFVGFYHSGGSYSMSEWMKINKNGFYQKTFTATANMANRAQGIGYGFCRVYVSNNPSGMQGSYALAGTANVNWIKIEKGIKATPWCPNEIDELYNIMGLDNNIQYDTSGYNNNGIKNNITYTSNTPKYRVSSSFSGSNNYIKVSENNWISQGAEAITVNFWAYSTDWSTRPKLISCTQSGGWNTQNGNTGYLRVPIHVYTNSTKTSTGYKYSSKEIKVDDLQTGWHMFTIIYDSTGNHIYLDGLPHSNYNFTSYGIHYNMNARLFLGCEASTASPASPYFKGNMSDFRIYCTALSAEDVLSLYNNSAYIDNQGNIYGAIYEEV